MNINCLMNDIKRSLGIGTFIKTRYSDYDLMKYIQSHTRNIVSRIYSTDILIQHIYFDKNNCVDATSQIYTFPANIMKDIDRQESFINGIKSIKMSSYTDDGVNRDAYTGHQVVAGYSYIPASNNMYSGIGGAMGNACMRQSIEMVRRSIRCTFLPPNRIRFGEDGMSPMGVPFDVTLRVGHPMSLYTIPQSLYSVFLKVAIYDIQEFLWNNELKDLEGLSNGYDNISLKIDDWADAGKLRDEFIEEHLMEDIAIQEGMHIY